MIHRSLIALATLAALGVSSSAFATVAATNTNVTANQQDAAIPITYTTRAGINSAGFDVNVTDPNNIIVDGSEIFQVFDFFANAFVACDGNQYTVAGGTNIACSPTGVYTITRTNATDIPSLAGAMRVLVDIAPAAAANATATVAFGPYCTGVQTPANDGCVAYFLADTNRDNAPAQPVANNGTITVQGVVLQPPTIAFTPNGGALALTAPANTAIGGASNVTNIVVDANGGVAPGSGSYSCTGLPVNFTVAPAANPAIVAGTNPADIAVSCLVQAAPTNGTLTCTRTGAVATDVVFNVSCPAGVVVGPVLTPTPANGTALTCNSQPGTTATTGIQIQNTGNAATAGLTCNTVGAGFAVTTQPAAVVAANGTTSATVTCTAPAQGATINGTLNCSAANGGGSLSFPLSSLGLAPVVAPSQPSIIPSTSLWAKVGLIGLLAALGLLMVGFRRHS